MSPNDSIRPFLRRHTFFGKLPEAVFEQLVGRGQTRTYAKGEYIYRKGEPGESLLVLISGRVKLMTVSVDGKEVVLHFLGVGDLYGEIAALDGMERAANAVALETSQAFLVYARDLLPALEAHPKAMFGVVQALCEKIRMGAALIEDSTLMMRGRVARGLLRLARQHGRRGADGVCLELTISQEELGKYLGLSRANVSRQLGQLREAGVIKLSGAQIIIIDEQALAEIAETGGKD